MYLKEAAENNTPLVHLESLTEDLEYYKENTFTNEFYDEMRNEILKLAGIVHHHAFDLEEDHVESTLFASRIKSHKWKRRNMLTMRVLRLNELGLGDDEAINAHSAAEI